MIQTKLNTHTTTKRVTNFALIVFISCFAAFVTSSCGGITNTLATIAPKPDAAKLMITPNVVDVDVDFKTKVKGESKKTRTALQAKDQAYYNAIANNNIDVLVDPVYSVTTKCKKSKAMVVGFAGHYKNLRTEPQAIQTALELAVTNAQKAIEQAAKDKQAAFDQQMTQLDKKMIALEKFAALNAISKEDLKTYLIITGGGNGGTTEKVLSTNQGIVDKFNSVVGCEAPAAAPAMSDAKPGAKEGGDAKPDDKGGKKDDMMKKIKGKMKK